MTLSTVSACNSRQMGCEVLRLVVWHASVADTGQSVTCQRQKIGITLFHIADLEARKENSTERFEHILLTCAPLQPDCIMKSL